MVKFIIKSIRVFGVVRRFISGALQTFGLPTPLRDRLRLRVVPHFSSGIVERAKREREWKSSHAKKGSPPAACRLFSRGVIFTRARVLLALLSLRKNGGLLVVYDRPMNVNVLMKSLEFASIILSTRYTCSYVWVNVNLLQCLGTLHYHANGIEETATYTEHACVTDWKIIFLMYWAGLQFSITFYHCA